MEIRKAEKDDAKIIAELALLAGEGIPAFFWAQSQKENQSIIDVGAHNALSENDNFSYKNAHVAVVNSEVAGMLLAYRLSSNFEEDLNEYPEFIRPLIELEQCVPESFYINMIATYPEFRNQSIGKSLMSKAEILASEAGCKIISIEVFEQNTGALKLYQRLGYRELERRAVIPHTCHPYTGEIILLTKSV